MSDDDRVTEASTEPDGHTSGGDVDRLERGVQPGHWVTRFVVALVLVVLAAIAFQVSASFFPRWWAQRIGNQVDGRFFAGTTWGLFYGFVFTFVPLLLLFQIRRRFFSWTWRGIVAVVAIVLAAPNWMTLAIVLGDSSAARAGRRILDVDGPNFRAASLAGAVVAAVAAIALTAFGMRLTHRKRQVEKLKNERDQLRSARTSDADER